MKTLIRISVAAVVAMLILEALMCLEASRHLQRAHMLESNGEILSAAREYQSAIGFYAPFNPFSRAAAIDMAAMLRREETIDESRAFNLEDRLLRSIRGTRSFYQPYRDISSRGSAFHGRSEWQAYQFRTPPFPAQSAIHPAPGSSDRRLPVDHSGE